ncbi:Serine/threonine protein kinase [Trema orientale]|uniref:Serine/threonine protein kinase n=1 Tax=Trema orientale TaxID=63057 RepID=A0A2P5ELC0_TREOI|nr:Serine/threonine protein kinase [Trema orientale]
MALMHTDLVDGHDSASVSSSAGRPRSAGEEENDRWSLIIRPLLHQPNQTPVPPTNRLITSQRENIPKLPGSDFWKKFPGFSTCQKRAGESQGSIKKVSVSSSRVKPCSLEAVICDSQSSSSTTGVARNRNKIKEIVRRPLAKILKKIRNIFEHCWNCDNCKESINDHYLPPLIKWYDGDHDLVQGCNLEDVVKACNIDSQSVSVNGNKDPLVMLKKVLGDIELTKHGLPTSVSVKFMKDIVSQLVELHASGITHGDLKPQNIFIIKGVRRLCAKLSDMSTSKRLLELLTSSLTQLGCTGNYGHQRSAGDMLSLGCVLFFYITGGKDPVFGGDQKKVVLNLSLVEDFPEAHHAISLLLSPSPQLRPKAIEVLYFPLLWKSKKRLSFFCDVNDLMRKYPLLWNDLKALTLKIIGTNSEGKPVFGWDQTMPQDLVNHMLKDHMLNDNITEVQVYYYNYCSVPDLLRFIRNVKTHYKQFPEDVESLMIGVSEPKELDGYFTSRFPNLLMEVYKLVRKYCEKERAFKSYFKGSV